MAIVNSRILCWHIHGNKSISIKDFRRQVAVPYLKLGHEGRVLKGNPLSFPSTSRSKVLEEMAGILPTITSIILKIYKKILLEAMASEKTRFCIQRKKGDARHSIDQGSFLYPHILAEEARVPLSEAVRIGLFSKGTQKIPVPWYGDPGYMATKSHWPYFKSLLSLKDQFISRLSTGNLVGSQNELVAANMQSDTNSEDNTVETETIEETLDTVNVNTASCFLKKFESSTTPLSTRLLAIEEQKLELIKTNKAHVEENVRKSSDVNILQFRNSVQDLVQRYAYGCN
nr:unnamed protein product [Callosobruchus analis]